MTANSSVESLERRFQNFERRTAQIRERYLAEKRKNPERFVRRIDFSWSIWMFGIEPFAQSIRRLTANDVWFVETKGDHFTSESGLRPQEVRTVLADYGVEVSGACGMFSEENDLSSSSPYVRQRAVDYVRRELEFLAEVAGRYLIVVPSAVGSPERADDMEEIRSAATLRLCGDDFAGSGIMAAIEPIRSAEVSIVHTVSEAQEYLNAVDHPAISRLNADTYHMLLGESHMGEAIISCGAQLANLHLADSNRGAPGTGMIDFDTVVMAAYLVGMNEEGRFLTAEPLGPAPDPYLLSHSPCRTELMDELVHSTMSYVRAREDFVRSLTE